jgi:hypothetical protein
MDIIRTNNHEESLFLSFITKYNLPINNENKDIYIMFFDYIIKFKHSKEQSITILCKNTFERLILHKLTNYFNYISKTVYKDTILPIKCNGSFYEIRDVNNKIISCPAKLRYYFGGECQCYSIPQKYEKYLYQDYDEKRYYYIPWTLKIGVEIRRMNSIDIYNQLIIKNNNYINGLPKDIITLIKLYL